MEIDKSKCKNCEQYLSNESQYCNNCGGKVINDRLTVKQIVSDTSAKVFGLDSTFLKTIKDMFVQPGKVMSDYVSGVRKRYLHPVTFLTIAATISIITFNFFSEDFVKINSAANEFNIEADVENEQKKYEKQIANLSTAAIDSLGIEPFDPVAYRQEAKEKARKGQLWTLKYFNLITFLMLPIYALISFLVFWKSHNFAEHLAFNSYVQGITFYGTTIFFLLSLVTHPLVYFATLIVTMFFYSYSFGDLYKLSLGKSLIKFLKFIGLLLIPLVLIFLAGVLVAHLSK